MGVVVTGIGSWESRYQVADFAATFVSRYTPGMRIALGAQASRLLEAISGLGIAGTAQRPSVARLPILAASMAVLFLILLVSVF